MRHNRKGRILIRIGLLMITAALLLAAYNLYEAYCAQQSAGEILDQLRAYLPEELTETNQNSDVSWEKEIPDYVLNPDMEMPIRTVGGMDCVGILRIPTLSLEFPVISEWSYSALKIAPCRYSGSAYSGDLVIAGHNYMTHFGKLKNLGEGNTIIFSDVDGNVFTYKVMLCEVLKPNDVEEMTDSGWDLTLFTCTAGGQNRVAIRCVLEENAS